MTDVTARIGCSRAEFARNDPASTLVIDKVALPLLNFALVATMSSCNWSSCVVRFGFSLSETAPHELAFTAVLDEGTGTFN